MEPMDMIQKMLNQQVLIKIRGNRELRGKLHAYDEHMNMILENVNETLTVVSTNDVFYAHKPESVVEVVSRTCPCLYVRGDGIILCSLIEHLIR